jgi:hypothetical protein
MRQLFVYRAPDRRQALKSYSRALIPAILQQIIGGTLGAVGIG